MPHLKFCKNQPLYVETAAFLRQAIKSGELPGNTRLDSVTGLAREFHTSRKVIENAIRLLKEEGLIISRPRQGLYVVPSENDRILVVVSSNSRAPNTTTGTLLSLLSESKGRKLEFIEAEFLRHSSEKFFKEYCANFSSVLLFNQGYQGNEPELDRLRDLHIPVLSPLASASDGPLTGFHTLYCDMVYGSRLLLEHLKKQNCRTVGFLGWHDSARKPLFRLPREKYLEIMAETGLKPTERMFETIYRDSFPGDSSLNDFMTDWQRFDAIVCYSHLTALHLYAWCRNNGVRIPDDLKVAACGIKLHSELLQPSLTAFHVDLDKHHRETLNFLQGKYPQKENVIMAIPPTLSIHASTSNKESQKQ